MESINGRGLEILENEGEIKKGEVKLFPFAETGDPQTDAILTFSAQRLEELYQMLLAQNSKSAADELKMGRALLEIISQTYGVTSVPCAFSHIIILGILTLFTRHPPGLEEIAYKMNEILSEKLGELFQEVSLNS